MSKNTHIYIQAGITIMQYIIPAFLLTNMTADQQHAVTLSLAILQGLFGVVVNPQIVKQEIKIDESH